MRLLPSLLMTVLAGLALASCGSGKLEEQDEAVRLAWANTMNQYQKRADLVPDLLSRVRLLAERDGAVVAAVVAAQGGVAGSPAAPVLLADEDAFSKAQAAQNALGAALANLVAAADRQSELAADETYRDLRAQLHGLESRIAMARKRYADAVSAYNGSVSEFPTNITAGMLDYEERPALVVRNEAKESKPSSVGGDTPKPLARN